MSKESYTSQETKKLLSEVFLISLKEELKKGVDENKDLTLFIKSIMSLAYYRGIEDAMSQKVAERELFL